MSLSLKAELETWAAALKAYDEQDFEKALTLFSGISDSSKILTNMGLIYATVGEHETAVEHFVAATNLDAYLAIAYFQCGVSNFLLERYDIALVNFEDAYLYLRGNEAINYEQIGLKFKLFSAEILFNKGLTQMNLGYPEEGMVGMQEATKQKVTEEHSVIDEAIRDRGEGYTVFSIPVGVLYRPSENKLKNSKTKDYLGKAKLVAAADADDAFTEFTGVKRRQLALGQDDNPAENSPNPEPSAPNRGATAPAPGASSHPSSTDTTAEQAVPRPTISPDRSKAGFPPAVGFRPDPATILAARRSQSVSNPIIAPPRPITSELGRSNSAQARSNTARLARSGTNNGGGIAPLAVRTPQGTSGGAGVGPGESRTAGETAPLAAPTSLQSQLSTRRPPAQVTPAATPRSARPSPPQSLQAGAYVIPPPQGMPPLVLPPIPGSTQGETGHLTKFYEMYMDAYTEEPASQGALPRPPAAQALSNGMTSSSQKQSPIIPPFYPSQEPELPPTRMQSSPSSTRTSTNTSSSSMLSRASSRGANATMNTNVAANPGMGTNGNAYAVEPGMTMNPNVAMIKGGGSINTGGGSLRRKMTRRPTVRRVTVYDDDEGDDGFVTGEYEEFEMANIRVKLHYQGDVRGMTIPPTTTFQEFVERVTTKFATSMMGLGMKFTDEEGTKISLRDESDFELAIETAREGSKGRSEGKMDVWCVDV